MQTINTPAKRVLNFQELDLVDNEATHAATTGYRAPEACWAPQRPVYVAHHNYTATTGFVAPAMCHAPQRRTEPAPAVSSSDEEESVDEPNLYSATTGFRPPKMCWAPKRCA
jgi:hypothetical protein